MISEEMRLDNAFAGVENGLRSSADSLKKICVKLIEALDNAIASENNELLAESLLAKSMYYQSLLNNNLRYIYGQALLLQAKNNFLR